MRKFWTKEDKETEKNNELYSFIMNPKIYKCKKKLGFIKVHTFEEELRERLKVFDNITAIRILQKRRYQIQTEMNAYKDYMLYYARQILKRPELIIEIPKYYFKHQDEFEFREKQRVIEKIIKELIYKERFGPKLA